MKKQIVSAGVLVGGFVLAVLWAALFWGSDRGSDAASGTESNDGATAASEDRRILGEEGSSGVVFTEFLDFECEACGAAYPFVEQLREQYEDEVTFEVRYFPIDSHANARNAAAAVESAYRQGEMEGMYQRMYETQASWGESQDSKASLFRGFAEDLGLDMEQFDQDVASDDVADRVQQDVDAGTDLGVTGTPTFFIDGELFEPSSLEDFNEALDEAVAETESR